MHQLSSFFDRPVGNYQAIDYRYFGRGSFRQGWHLFNIDQNEDYALKTNRYMKGKDFDVDEHVFGQVQIEAITMLENQHSKRTTAIFGYCGTSILVEVGSPLENSIFREDTRHFVSQEKLDREQVDDVKPKNDYTPPEKLRMVLAMAESVAVIHGNPKGVLANHDLGIDQWLTMKDGTIKLNDFNKARFLPFNPDKREYCKFWSHQDYDVYLAPEEIEGEMVTEAIDVCVFGKIVYTILTGLMPYYHKKTGDAAFEAIELREPPFVDPRYRARSIIEGRLVEMMEMCWVHDPEGRASIFEVVAHLRETARLANIPQEYLDAV